MGDGKNAAVIESVEEMAGRFTSELTTLMGGWQQRLMAVASCFAAAVVGVWKKRLPTCGTMLFIAPLGKDDFREKTAELIESP